MQCCKARCVPLSLKPTDWESVFSIGEGKLCRSSSGYSFGIGLACDAVAGDGNFGPAVGALIGHFIGQRKINTSFKMNVLH